MRTFDHRDFTAARLAECKGDQTVSVVLPAYDEADTIGPIVELLVEELQKKVPLVDELVVIDDHSEDDTSRVAAEAGAVVHHASEILPEIGPNGGKGSALWRSLAVTSGDLVTWCDADISNFDTRFVLGPLGPLLTDPAIGFVKAHYDRPLGADGRGGGRVTELLARPLLATLHPELDRLVQPLSGEFGGRRELLEAVPFWSGYAVDLGLILDLADRFGSGMIAQVDLGERIHRNRSLAELGPQATIILAMALTRQGIVLPDPIGLTRGDDHVAITLATYPPMRDQRR